jgi:transcriptional regulator with XRE-family HTH domain
MTDDKTSIKLTAARLRKARKAKQLTQVEVASKADVSISYYAQVERGEINPTASKLLSIIEALGVGSKDILGK